MENLSLFSLNNTNLYHLENGVQHPLLSRCQLDIILVELKDQTDVETLGLNYLCFLTWVLEDKSIISIPLLSGATVTKKDEGYLVMLGSSKVYYVEFPGAPAEVYESFKAVLSEFTRANSVTVGKTLPEQLDYIYGKGEGAVSTENLPASEEHSGLTKVVVKCSECLHYAIVSTASIAGKGIKKGAQLYIKHSSPQGEYHVNENVKKGLDVFASTAGKVAEVAQNVVGTTADILSQGVNMIISPFQNHESQGHIKIPKELKATGNFFITTLDSFGHVYGGVIEGTEIIIGDLTSSTVDVASHRYGIRVGEATQSGMTAINSYTKAAKHVANFTHPVRFARAITKTTGKRIVATKPSGKKGTEKVEKVDSELSLRSLMGNNTLGALPKRSEGHVVVSREEMQKRGMSEESVDLSSRCPPELSHGPNAKA